MTDPDDRDMLAAEYVLGTLDASERAGVAERLPADPGLARAVLEWEERLSPLVDAVPDVAPPADAFAAIARRLFGPAARGEDPDLGGSVVALRRSLRRWQGATAGFALAAAALLAWIALPGAEQARGAQRFTAVLQRDAGAPAMIIDVDLAGRSLTVRPIVASPPAGRAYELWIIDPSLGAPRSLGMVPSGAQARDSLVPFDAAVITGATYAVTLEAPGGSSTGRPTGAPVLAGKLSPFPS